MRPIVLFLVETLALAPSNIIYFDNYVPLIWEQICRKLILLESEAKIALELTQQWDGSLIAFPLKSMRQLVETLFCNQICE